MGSQCTKSLSFIQLEMVTNYKNCWKHEFHICQICIRLKIICDKDVLFIVFFSLLENRSNNDITAYCSVLCGYSSLGIEENSNWFIYSLRNIKKNQKNYTRKKTPFSVRNEKKSKNFKMLTPTQCKWKISHLQMNVNCYNFSHNRRSKMKLPLFNTRNSETNNYGKMTTEGIQFWLSHLLFPIYQYTYGLSSSEF